jgi:hypothetical protein
LTISHPEECRGYGFDLLDRRDLLVHDAGPGRSTRLALVREFHDQRQSLTLHEEKPLLVKCSRIGPSRTVFLISNPMVAGYPNALETTQSLALTGRLVDGHRASREVCRAAGWTCRGGLMGLVVACDPSIGGAVWGVVARPA